MRENETRLAGGQPASGGLRRRRLARGPFAAVESEPHSAYRGNRPWPARGAKSLVSRDADGVPPSATCSVSTGQLRALDRILRATDRDAAPYRDRPSRARNEPRSLGNRRRDGAAPGTYVNPRSV